MNGFIIKKYICTLDSLANGERISGLAKLTGLSHVAERIHRNKPTMQLQEENKERTRRQGYME